MRILIIASILVLASCDNGPYTRQEDRPDCSAHRAELAGFILECAKAANPLSDEEGEDLVIQCQRTGESVLCPMATFNITRSCEGCSFELRIEKVSE